jgi:drug/metabolite transporter (DMT)-like permease
MNKKAFTLAMLTVVIWGSAFAAIRASLQGGYTSGHLVLFRYLIASLAFVIYSLISSRKFQLPKKEDWVLILLLGWIGISTYHIGVTFGSQTVSAGTAAMLVASSPIFTTIFAMVWLKERLGRLGWIGLFIGFAGIAIITIGSNQHSFTISSGVVFVLVAAVATSVFFVLQKPLFSRYRPIELTAYFTWAGTLPFLIFSPGLIDGIRHATLQANLSAVYVGIFPAGVAYVTWAMALSMGNASSISTILYIEPVFAIITAWIWLQEFPSPISIIGGIVTVCGVLLVNLLGNKRNSAHDIQLE